MDFSGGHIHVVVDPATHKINILWNRRNGTMENLMDTTIGILALSDVIESVCTHKDMLCNECDAQCEFAL